MISSLACVMWRSPRQLAFRLSLLFLVLGGCTAERQREQPLRVVATIAPLADWAREVGAERVAVDLVVPVSADPRTFEPSDEQRLEMRAADVVLMNGLGLEPWIDAILERAPASRVHVLDMSEFVGPRTEQISPADLGTPAAPRSPPNTRLLPAPLYSPYLWLDPGMALTQVDLIAQTLIRADPDGLALYRRNAARYGGDLENLDGDIRRQINGWMWTSILGHDRFLYPFARHYGLRLEVLADATSLSFVANKQPVILDRFALPSDAVLPPTHGRPVVVLNPLGHARYIPLMESSVLSMTAVMVSR